MELVYHGPARVYFPTPGSVIALAGGFAGALAVLLKDTMSRWIMRPELYVVGIDCFETPILKTFYLVVGNQGRTTATLCAGQVTMLPSPMKTGFYDQAIARALREGVFDDQLSARFKDLGTNWRSDGDPEAVSIHPGHRQRLIVARADLRERRCYEPSSLLAPRDEVETIPWPLWQFTARVGSDTARTLTAHARLEWDPWTASLTLLDWSRDPWWPWLPVIGQLYGRPRQWVCSGLAQVRARVDSLRLFSRSPRHSQASSDGPPESPPPA